MTVREKEVDVVAANGRSRSYYTTDGYHFDVLLVCPRGDAMRVTRQQHAWLPSAGHGPAGTNTISQNSLKNEFEPAGDLPAGHASSNSELKPRCALP